jgi:hypothetical protein
MMMEIKLWVQRWEHLKAHGIRRDSCKVIIPEEAQHALALLDSCVFRQRLLAIRLFLFVVHTRPCLWKTDAEEEDVTELELDAGLPGYLDDRVEGDFLLC